MAESELLLSPQDDGVAIELSQKVYRKRILPKATINYRGRKITFDEQYLADLANSYQQSAYDQVAFMLADTTNSHTLDPERFRGEVLGVDVADDGLYAKIQVTPEMADLLKLNPKLGVSARILENYERSDGKRFPRALQHVLGTLDPVIPGLGTWEEVALSNGVPADNVLDLSATSYEELEHMATRADHLKQVAEATDMTPQELDALGMTDEELAIFASAFDVSSEVSAEIDDDELVEEPGDGLFDTVDILPSEADIQAAVEALSDEELEQLAAELGVDLEDEAEVEAEVETPDETEEPTDAELVERLGNGDFGSGIDEETPDPDLGDLTDEALAEMTQMWEAAHAADLATAETAESADDAEDWTVVSEDPGVEDSADLGAPGELVGAAPVALSNEAAPEVVALSNQVTALQQKLAAQEFDTLKRDYVRKGVPAALVDLARPVLLAGPAATLEFSNAVGQTESVDAASVVRQLLDSATGYIDLARERGHNYAPEGDDLAAIDAEEDKRLASLWGEQYGN